HAEVRLQRLRRVEIVAIATAPAERVTGGLLEPGHVDAACAERLELLHRVVVADDSDELHRRQVARRGGEEDARAAKDVVGLPERSFDGVERDGADDENRHGVRRDDGVRARLLYIRSGAVMPSSESPFRSTMRAARASTSRARVIGSGS